MRERNERKEEKNPRRSSTRPRPSKDAHAVLRELYGTQMRSSMLSGSSMGRNDSVCGQIGVMRSAGISGCTRLPPAESEYAVLPVGVATHSPSACTVVMWCSSPADAP
jgi:hypothetical protein